MSDNQPSNQNRDQKPKPQKDFFGSKNGSTTTGAITLALGAFLGFYAHSNSPNNITSAMRGASMDSSGYYVFSVIALLLVTYGIVNIVRALKKE
jgi:hypothetical protein